MMRGGIGTFWLTASALVLASCGGDGPPSNGGATGAPGPAPTPSPPPAGQAFSVPAAESLSSAEVGTIIAQAAAEARARGAAATIAVTDRVGNVLAVFAMPGAQPRWRGSRRHPMAPIRMPRGWMFLPPVPPSPRPSPGPTSHPAAMPSPPARRASSFRSISRLRRQRRGLKAARCSGCSSASCRAAISPRAPATG